MFDIPFITEDGTEYTLTITYVYHHCPAILAADHNDCCDDESELEMDVAFFNTEPLESHYEEMADSWDSREEGSLYKRAEIKAIKDYFEGDQ